MSGTGGGSRAVLRQVRSLFGGGAAGGLSDGQLLERFATRGDAAEAAFAAIVDRHGAMVLRVGRSVLRDEHDAQDAFQATFLVLARKARSLRVRDSLAPWLRDVAYRTALGARTAALRRKARERGAARGEAEPGPPAADDLGPVLHEELGRLPERFRAAVVLCCLEGLTHEQAARALGCPPGTLQSRLARGRARLRDRLVRRGLAPAAAGLLAAPAADASSLTLPPGYALLACRAGLSILGKPRVAVDPVAVMLAKEVVNAMILTKLKALTVGAAVLGAAAFGAKGYALQQSQDQEGMIRHQMEQRLAPFFLEASKLPKDDQETLWFWLSHGANTAGAPTPPRDRLEPMLRALRMVAPEKADQIRDKARAEDEKARVADPASKLPAGGQDPLPKYYSQLYQERLALGQNQLAQTQEKLARNAAPSRWEYKVVEALSSNNLEHDLNEWAGKGWDLHQTTVRADPRSSNVTFTAVLRRPAKEELIYRTEGGVRP